MTKKQQIDQDDYHFDLLSDCSICDAPEIKLADCFFVLDVDPHLLTDRLTAHVDYHDGRCPHVDGDDVCRGLLLRCGMGREIVHARKDW